MMIYGYIPKSKKRKVSKLVQQRNAEWLASIEAISPKRNITTYQKINHGLFSKDSSWP